MCAAWRPGRFMDYCLVSALCNFVRSLLGPCSVSGNLAVTLRNCISPFYTFPHLSSSHLQIYSLCCSSHRTLCFCQCSEEYLPSMYSTLHTQSDSTCVGVYFCTSRQPGSQRRTERGMKHSKTSRLHI